MPHSTKVCVLSTCGHVVPWQEQVLESCVQAPVPAPSPRVTLGKSLKTYNLLFSLWSIILPTLLGAFSVQREAV